MLSGISFVIYTCSQLWEQPVPKPITEVACAFDITIFHTSHNSRFNFSALCGIMIGVVRFSVNALTKKAQ